MEFVINKLNKNIVNANDKKGGESGDEQPCHCSVEPTVTVTEAVTRSRQPLPRAALRDAPKHLMPLPARELSLNQRADV